MSRLPTLVCSLALFSAPMLCAQDTTFTPAQILNADEVSDEVARWYPHRLRDLGVTGSVLLRLKIDAQGRVTSRELYSSSGVRTFDRAALRAVDKVRLRPAQRNGVSVASEMLLPVRFEGDPRSGVVQLTHARVVNRDTVTAAAFARFPKNMRGTGINAYSSIALEVEDSVVRAASLTESSCFHQLDELALELSRMLRIAADTPGIGYLNLVFAFRRDSLQLIVAGDTTVQDTVNRPPRQTPAPTTKRPELRNRDVVGRELVRHYPDDLKRRGLGGEVVVWMLIDERGHVIRREVANTSGICAIDAAGLEVAGSARFFPALVDGKPQRVWIQLPIIFRSRP